MDYVPHSSEDKEAMLRAIGVASSADLFHDIPEDVRHPTLDLPPGMAEPEVIRHMQSLAGLNRNVQEMPSFLGAGSYNHFVPSIVNALILRGEFLTSYTPYQPELSQGTLQVMYEFQSMVCMLTGMDVANASMYDEATATAEAVLTACSITKRSKVIVPDTFHPTTLEVLETYAEGRELTLVRVPVFALDDDGTFHDRWEALSAAIDGDTACVAVQVPNFLGWVHECQEIADTVHAHGAMLVVSADPVALGILTPPGEYGADIVTGEGHSLALPPAFGGPRLGLYATRKRYMRQMPGRVSGMTKDLEGKRGFVMTLQAREQHIRREKATSNICTNEALAALAFTINVSWLGPAGMRKKADLCLAKSHYAAAEIDALAGFSVTSPGPYIKEFVVHCPAPASSVNEHLLEHGVLGGYDLGRVRDELDHHMLVCVTELSTREDIDRLVTALGGLG